MRARETTRRRRVVYAPVTFSEERGVRYLHFGTEWVQGAMRLSKPDRIELEYAQQMMAWMLFIEAPSELAQLGLGAASLTKFCHRHWPSANVTAVEMNPAVIAAARSMFRLPPDRPGLTVIEADAWDYVTDTANHGTLDVLQVDLYDATARGPVLDDLPFYSACRACLRPQGMMVVNLFGDHPSYIKNMGAIGTAFDSRVIALPEVHLGNRIALAFQGVSVVVAWSELDRRADAVEALTGLPARQWVKGLDASVKRAARATKRAGANKHADTVAQSMTAFCI